MSSHNQSNNMFTLWHFPMNSKTIPNLDISSTAWTTPIPSTPAIIKWWNINYSTRISESHKKKIKKLETSSKLLHFRESLNIFSSFPLLIPETKQRLDTSFSWPSQHFIKIQYFIFPFIHIKYSSSEKNTWTLNIMVREVQW